MALIGRSNKNRNSSRASRPAARKIELKNSVKRSAINKNLRRASVTKKKKSGLLRLFWQKIRAPLVLGFGIGLGLLSFLLVGAALIYSYNFFTTNRYFAVKTIEIEGHNRLKSREVLEIAGVDYGQNTLAISIDEIEGSLSGSPWIAETSVRRVLPDGIRIKIREHAPSYWVQQSGQLLYADEYGAPIAPVQAGNFASYPLLAVESGAEYLAERLPELVESLEKVSFPIMVETAASIKLYASQSLELSLDSGLRLVIGLDNWDGNLNNTVRVLEDLTRRGELKKAAEIKAHGRGVWVTTKRGRA